VTCDIKLVSQDEQESLATAKVSARQPWYIGHNSPSGGRPIIIYEIYTHR